MDDSDFPPEGLIWKPTVEDGEIVVEVRTDLFGIQVLVVSIVLTLFGIALAVWGFAITPMAVDTMRRHGGAHPALTWAGTSLAVCAALSTVRSAAAFVDRPVIRVSDTLLRINRSILGGRRGVHVPLHGLSAFSVESHHPNDWLPFSNSWKLVASHARRPVIVKLRLQTREQASWACEKLNRLVRENRV